MKKEMAVRKNLDLLDIFMKYAFDHPNILDKIPSDAELVILPKGDSELYSMNKKLAESMVNEGKKVVIVHLQEPKIEDPQMSLLSA